MACTQLCKRAWVFFAVLTLVFYGGANFLSGVIGKEAEDAPSAGKSTGQVQLLTGGITGILTIFALSLRGTACFKDGRSVFALLASGIALGTGVLVLATALASNFLMAPFIAGVLPVNAVFLVVACRMFLRERTTVLQMAAIAVAVLGLGVMATADRSSKDVRGILYGLVVAGCFAVGNFGIKYASLRGVVEQSASAGMLWLGMGVVGLTFFAAESVATGTCFKGLESTTGHLHWLSLASAVLQTLGTGVMEVAISLGPAAPGTAIANANATVVLVLNQIFFQPQTNSQQIIGLLMSIGGVFVLSIAPKTNQAESDHASMREPALEQGLRTSELA